MKGSPFDSFDFPTGRCVGRPIPKIPGEPVHSYLCEYDRLLPGYKFYLSFENTRCTDYITEKFFLAMRHRVVPVVMGPPKGDYLAAGAPEGAFIHVDDFGSPEDLARYIEYLDANDTAYEEYFGIKENFRSYDFADLVGEDNPACGLCRMLNEERPFAGSKKVDLESFWIKGSGCH